MNTAVKSILCLALASLLLSARPTYAGACASSGTFLNEGPQVASTGGAVAPAQDSPLLTDDLPEAIQKALAELGGRRREVEALKSAVGARDDKIRVLEGIIAQQEQIIALWKTAATDRAAANALDAKIEASYKATVTSYELELARVRIERDKARRAKKWWGLAGVVFGVVVTVIATTD